FLDPRGQLLELAHVPDRERVTPGRPANVDWKPLFEEARLDWARARPTDPKWTPPFFADQSLAWEAPRPDGTGEPLRVEAAVHQGKVVYFKVFHGPWDRPDPLDGLLPAEPKPFQYAYAALFCLVLVGATGLARRNVHLGLGDPAGATRLAG